MHGSSFICPLLRVTKTSPVPLIFSSSQVAERLRKEVEDLVLEVFERLPQTVDGFREGNIAGSGMEASRLIFLYMYASFIFKFYVSQGSVQILFLA